MKKAIALIIAFMLLVGMLTGCGAIPNAESPAQTADVKAPESTSNEAAVSETYSPDGSVIFEKDGVRVTTAGLDFDPTDGEVHPIIWIDIVNSSDTDAYLGVANGSVNGFMASVLLVDFYMEDGEYYGANYDFSITVPAGESGRYALSYYKSDVDGVDMDTLSEMEFSFTTAEDELSWYNYVSEPIIIKTGETVEDVEISALGTVVLDDEKLLLVIGEQDYDDYFGPVITFFAENKTEHWIGLSPETAEGNGVFCDYLYGATYLAPGKKDAGIISFDGELRDLKGIENLSLTYRIYEADSYDDLTTSTSVTLDPITVSYPLQVWGEYENGGMSFNVKPKYNNLITVETPENDPNGVLFAVSESASLEAGAHEGAGWLFSIARIDKDRLHELLCNDMSGADVFAKNDGENYFLMLHPTDVRFERASAEEMERDIGQWTMLNAWAGDVADSFINENDLENQSFSNTPVDIYLSRAAWMDGISATLSGEEYGSVEVKDIDSAPYVEFVMKGWFCEADSEEMPDGEYVSLSFPEDDTRLDFFLAPGSYVRVISGDHESLYQSVFYDENLSPAEAVLGWYYAAAEKAGLKDRDSSLDAFYGTWAEKIAGRGMITVTNTLSPGKVKLEVLWPESAGVKDTWEMVAVLDGEGKLVYENGIHTVIEFDEDGNEWITGESCEESGWIFLNDSGELCWHDNNAESGEESVFIN